MTIPRDFTCSHCGNYFQSVRYDSEAMAETVAMFGKQSASDDWIVLCDGCWNGIMTWLEERKWKQRKLHDDQET